MTQKVSYFCFILQNKILKHLKTKDKSISSPKKKKKQISFRTRIKHKISITTTQNLQQPTRFPITKETVQSIAKRKEERDDSWLI